MIQKLANNPKERFLRLPINGKKNKWIYCSQDGIKKIEIVISYENGNSLLMPTDEQAVSWK
jgi:hypothetical protein